MVHDSEEVQRTISGKVSRHYASLLEHKIEISALTVMKYQFIIDLRMSVSEK